MNLNKTDLNLFIAFDVIYREKNLTKAGEVLGITQPAVSNSLSRLREIFDDELFTRTSKGMVPTAVSQNIIDDVRSALKLFSSTISDSETFKPESARTTFKISAGDLSEFRLLPSLINSLSKLAPEIDIESYLTPRKNTPRELAAGNLDFIIDPPIHSDASLRHKEIFKDNYVLIVRKNHPITKKKKLTMADYLELSHIHISNSRTGLGHVDMALYRLGESRRIALRAQHFLVAPFVISQSDLALTSTKSFLVSKDLTSIKLPFTVDPVELHLYWHETKHNDPGNIWMRNLISKEYKKLKI
jgi:DNA-binding transcriptional LysR family regulator